MNAGGECADKGEDNDCARSVGVPQEEVNGGCELGSDALEATERLGEIERRGVNDSHLEGRDDHGACEWRFREATGDHDGRG